MPSLVRGEIIEVDFKSAGKHPGIILSCSQFYKIENSYLCVMMTNSKISDLFNYPLRKEMYEDSDFFKDGQQVRIHLISYFQVSELGMAKGAKLKKRFVDEIVDRIASITMGNS